MSLTLNLKFNNLTNVWENNRKIKKKKTKKNKKTGKNKIKSYKPTKKKQNPTNHTPTDPPTNHRAKQMTQPQNKPKA
ncbi:hypothetical protein GMMP1_1480002 [Candidatus Magnetomoraceae bacterium gMMP-1]